MPVPVDAHGRLDLARLPANDYLALAYRSDLAVADREEASCRVRVPDPCEVPARSTRTRLSPTAERDLAAYEAAAARVERAAAAQLLDELLAERRDDLADRRRAEASSRHLALIRRGGAA